MKNQETNNQGNNQESGCTFYLKNGTSQFVPGASFKSLADSLNDKDNADSDSDWLAYGNCIIIRLDQIVEVINGNPEEEEYED